MNSGKDNFTSQQHPEYLRLQDAGNPIMPHVKNNFYYSAWNKFRRMFVYLNAPRFSTLHACYTRTQQRLTAELHSNLTKLPCTNVSCLESRLHKLYPRDLISRIGASYVETASLYCFREIMYAEHTLSRAPR